MRNERMHKGRIYNEREVYEEPPHMGLPARFSVGNEAGERGCGYQASLALVSMFFVSKGY
jgi:hypothetical protein